jgi:hypothetical protein
VVDSCEHGNEPSDFIIGWEFLDQMSDYQFLKKDSDPWSYFRCVYIFKDTGRQLCLFLDFIPSTGFKLKTHF